jgi:outer membrane protein TolC
MWRLALPLFLTQRMRCIFLSIGPAAVLAAFSLSLTVPAVTGQGVSFDDPFHSSVPAAQATREPLALSLDDAIGRALKSNLGILVRANQTSSARADRLTALAALLPTVYTSFAETSEQISLASYGFHFPGVPSFIGPFGIQDLRATAEAKVFDLSLSRNLKAVAERARAAALSEQDARDLVVEAVASGYFSVLAGTALTESLATDVGVAEMLYQIARDRHSAGVTPAIDELRAKVEWQTQQQRLLGQQNQVAKDRLTLARVIGLAPGQEFRLSDLAPFAPLEGLTAEDLFGKALASRADYQSAQSMLRAAELSRQAVDAARYPTLTFSGNYGDIGPTLAESHGTYAATGTLKFYLFDGRIRAGQETAAVEIKQRREELENLKGRIDYQVRSALLDLKTAADQVAVARDRLDLATQTLDQARDRFSAGVTGNIEVVEAQEAVSTATQSLISSQFAHNLGKAALARAVGMAESSLKQFMGSK